MLEGFKGLRVSRKQFGHCGLCLQKELKSGHDGTDPRRWKLEGQELKVIPVTGQVQGQPELLKT